MTEPSILQAVAEATRLREGPEGVAAILRAVYRAGSLRLQDAAREARLPMPVASAIRRELEKAGLLERKQGLALSPEGRDFVERELGLGSKIDLICPSCAGHGIVIPEKFHALVERLAAIVAQAPAVDVTLDQAPCTPETAMLRALLMLQNGALEGRRVLLLGDDDSVSIAIGLLGQAQGSKDLTRGVVVIDADERRLAFLRHVAEREQIALQTIRHDLRQPLPEALRRSFDVIETDPPYTLDGARLFLTRGCEALASGASGHCFFSFAQWPAQQMLQLQQVFLQLGLAVHTVRPGFNHYAGATVLGNVGQLIELIAVNPAGADLPAWDGPLYTAEVNPRLRAYVCAECGAEIVLGRNGAPDTVEALKAQGCGACGGRVFRRQATRP
ncbi:MAG: bis-aminopropyl spermidine synthase family protein [Rhodopseudomonas sp.]|uniref:bis-aminopropyl spermidine synthase family protein n=1 Tax=Rhodopseudomonas sp. TaxID=1078 RepID=UPI0018498FB9|nr:bis-aminopropyl spermidine synthase family protein [Rhodopseudomonas sp.]NVN87441.1 bis-aminopropyl spermidine synthase family protein [Rhodopseudomonas sp.]